MRLQLLRSLFLLGAGGCAYCGDDDDHSQAPPAEPDRLVSILVEVYDPVTNFVWENVSVRVVSAEQEWSASNVVSPYVDWYLTDSTGRVWLDENVLAFSEVGFLLDGSGPTRTKVQVRTAHALKNQICHALYPPRLDLPAIGRVGACG